MKPFKQLFFISPNGFMPVRQAFDDNGGRIAGIGTHGWAPDGSDPQTDQIIGVVEMDGTVDSEDVIDRLEARGIMWLPNHLTADGKALNTDKIKPEHASALAKHGVNPSHTTAQAMTLVHAKAGFPPLNPKNPKRF